jgi:hypothetical protein
VHPEHLYYVIALFGRTTFPLHGPVDPVPIDHALEFLGRIDREAEDRSQGVPIIRGDFAADLEEPDDLARG